MQHWTPPSFDALPSDEAVSAGTASASLPAAGLGLPTVDEIQAIRARAHQEAFAKGLQEGLTEGRAQGVALGKSEGYEQGRSEGFEAGFQQGYQSGADRLERQVQALQQVLEAVGHWPAVLQEVLPEWVYETALRLTGRSQMDKTVFKAAVHEAMQRLPRPGDSMFIRVSAEDLDAWQSFVKDLDIGAQALIQADAELPPGQAHVEVQGTRIDLGAQARDALVRSALGLLPTQRPLIDGA